MMRRHDRRGVQVARYILCLEASGTEAASVDTLQMMAREDSKDERMVSVIVSMVVQLWNITVAISRLFYLGLETTANIQVHYRNHLENNAG